MKKDIIEKLRYPANLTAWIFGQDKGNWEGFDPDKNLLTHKVIDNNTLKFYWKDDPDGTYIMYKNIRPKEISSTKYDDPDIISSETKDAYSSTATNLSNSVTMKRSYSIAEGASTSMTDNLGVSVAVGLEQSISYGGELSQTKGETKISVFVNTSFNHEWSSGTSEERTIETSIDIPPQTRTILTATKSRSKLRQKIHYECDLNFTVEFESYGICWFEVESIDMMKQAFEDEYYDGLWNVKEGDGGAQDRADEVGYALAKLPRRYEKNLMPTVVTKLTKEIKFDKSVTGEVILKSVPLAYTIQSGESWYTAVYALGLDGLETLYKLNPEHPKDKVLGVGDIFYGYER